MLSQEENPSFGRRFRRSSDPMIALWCLFEHARTRYCLRSVVLIDDYGTELLSSGEDLLEEESQEGTPTMVSVPLPGRRLPGLLVVDAPADVLRPALDDLQSGIARIFEERGASEGRLHE